jgi:cytidylate kinase
MLKIAIDGPAGAGKSTVAKAVAQKLGIKYVDTGAMYRAVVYEVLRRGVESGAAAAVAEVASSMELRWQKGEDATDRVYLGSEDITDAIRLPRVSGLVSQVAAYPEVRKILTAWQREAAAVGSVVMEGRDIGTIVMPEAELKVFLTASEEARAQRRRDELGSKGLEADLPSILAAQKKRDKEDSERSMAPLLQAQDARVLDTTGISAAEAVEIITAWALDCRVTII